MSIFKNSNPILDLIKEQYSIANVPKYRDYKNNESKSIKRSNPTSTEVIEEVDYPEVEYPEEETLNILVPIENEITPGTYFDPRWETPSYKWPRAVIEEDEPVFETTLPDVYSIQYAPRPWYDGIFNAINYLGNEITLNHNNMRVKNMLRVNQNSYFNVPPRRIASGMATLGSLLSKVPTAPTKVIGYGLQVPDFIYDTHDYVESPTTSNFLSLAGDVAGFAPIEASRAFLSIPDFTLTLPTFDSSSPSTTTVTVPSPGPALNLGLSGLQLYGFTDDLMGTFDYNLYNTITFKDDIKQRDPDNIQIGTNPFSIRYQYNANMVKE